MQSGPIINSPRIKYDGDFQVNSISSKTGQPGGVDESGNSRFPCDEIKDNITKDSCISWAFYTFFLFIMVCIELSDVSFDFEAGIWSSRHGRNGPFQ